MTTPQSYPARNPFPHQGTIRLAGQRVPDGNLPVLAGEFRTVFRPPIKRLQRFLTDFQARFLTEWSADGGAAFIRGPSGSGKSHSIFAVWKTLQPAARVFPVYIIVQENSFLGLYRQFAGRLSLTLLVDLSRALLADITVEQLSSDPSSGHVDQNTLKTDLKADPELVKNLFSTYAVPEGAAKARQRVALSDLTQGDNDLNRAVQCLQGDQFPAYAADWFCAKPVAPDKLQAMGISGPIGTPRQAAAALELLAALFTVADLRLVVFIDQFEKLTQGDPATVLTNTGLVRSLIESFESRNAALILSGTREGWDNLPDDARQRIGLNVIDCELLTLEESLDLVRLYVIPIEAEFRPGSGSLFPFTEEAVREIIRLSAGNPRRLLQYCHMVFRTAEPSQSVIDLALVNSTAKTELANLFFDKSSVVRETRRILTRQPYRLAENFTLLNRRFDFALLEDQTVAVLVNVSDAVYGDDEAVNAYLTADMVSELRNAGELATFILVVTGYVTPEITGRVALVVNRLIVFSPEDFESRLQHELEWVRAHPPTFNSSSEERMGATQSIARIVSERAIETSVLQKREAEVSETHAGRRYAERRAQAQRDWSAQRPDIEKRIAEERLKRATAARDAFDKAQHSANVRRWLQNGAVFLSGGVLLYLTPLFNKAFELIAIGLFLVPAADFVLMMSHYDLTSRSLSESDFLRLANRPLALPIDLWGSSPVGRFIRNARRIRRSLVVGDALTDLFRSETLSILRASYARSMREVKTPFQKQIFAACPEAAVLVENPAELFRDGASASPITRELLGLDQDKEKEKKKISALATAFDRGLDRSDLTELRALSEREIRTAMRELSPFDANGLGTFDFYPRIADVDAAYLFCNQLLLYFERNLLDNPE